MRERRGKPRGDSSTFFGPDFGPVPELAAEPGPGVGPVLLGRGRGDAQNVRRLREGTPEEVPELDQLGLAWGLGGQPVQGLLDGQDLQRVAGASEWDVVRLGLPPGQPAAVFAARLAP